MLEYDLDISSGSYSQILTPDASARAFQFYATEYGCFHAGSRYFTRRDGKNAALLLYTVEGCGEMEWNGQKCLLEPGSAVVIYCDTYHHYRTISEAPWVFRWLHFDGAGLDGYRPMLLEQLTPVLFGEDSAIAERFRTIESTGAAGGIQAWAEISHAISGMLLEMLRHISGHDADTSAPCRNEVLKLASYIQNNHIKPLTAEDFMAVTNLSRYHLIHMFRQQMGIPPYKYMHYCRVNHAQQLLRTTDDPVSVISEKVGYPDPVNFIRQFRLITGTTPAKYRRESIQLP